MIDGRFTAEDLAELALLDPPNDLDPSPDPDWGIRLMARARFRGELAIRDVVVLIPLRAGRDVWEHPDNRAELERTALLTANTLLLEADPTETPPPANVPADPQENATP